MALDGGVLLYPHVLPDVLVAAGLRLEVPPTGIANVLVL